MPVSPAHLLALVSDDVVDDPLIDPSGGQAGDEGMAEGMEPLHDPPLTVPQGPASLLAPLDYAGIAEQRGTAGMGCQPWLMG